MGTRKLTLSYGLIHPKFIMTRRIKMEFTTGATGKVELERAIAIPGITAQELEAFRKEIARIWSVLPQMGFCTICCGGGNMTAKSNEILRNMQAFCEAWSNEYRIATYKSNRATHAGRHYGRRGWIIIECTGQRSSPSAVNAPTRAGMN